METLKTHMQTLGLERVKKLEAVSGSVIDISVDVFKNWGIVCVREREGEIDVYLCNLMTVAENGTLE